MNPIWLPQVGLKFRNLDDAWLFWVNYGGCAGFEVRKRYTNKRPNDDKVTSCRFVCACSGAGQVADVIVYKDNMKESQDYKDNLSFTQLLMVILII